MTSEPSKEVGRKSSESADFQDRGIQSPCVSIRVLVQITARNAAGMAEIYSARAILLNQRGVRFECLFPAEQRSYRKNPFKLHQILWIEVCATGKASGGKVLWLDPNLNPAGNYEFVAEINDSKSLFEVPLSAGDAGELTALIDDLDAIGGSEALPDPPGEPSAAETNSKMAEAPVEAAENPANGVDSATVTEGESPVGETSPEELPLSALAVPALEKPALPQDEVSCPPCESMEAEMNLVDEHSTATDRLADLFKEAIETAVRKENERAAARLLKEAEDQVNRVQQAASEKLRNEMNQQANILEDRLMQQCRSRAEHMLAGIMKPTLNSISTEIDQVAAKTEERVQAIFGRLVEQLELRSAEILAETNTKLQEQIEKVSAGIYAAILQKFSEELVEKQKNMMEQVQQQIGMVTEQNLVKLRGGLVRALKELSEIMHTGNPSA